MTPPLSPPRGLVVFLGAALLLGPSPPQRGFLKWALLKGGILELYSSASGFLLVNHTPMTQRDLAAYTRVLTQSTKATCQYTPFVLRGLRSKWRKVYREIRALFSALAADFGGRLKLFLSLGPNGLRDEVAVRGLDSLIVVLDERALGKTFLGVKRERFVVGRLHVQVYLCTPRTKRTYKC